MINKKILSLAILIALTNISLFAKQDADMIRYEDYVEKKVHKPKKEYKEKTEKKQYKENKVQIANLPAHLQRGKIADEKFLNKGTMINTNKYENIKNTDIYRVDDRVFRIARNTREILDVLK